jgi:pimeloyl-ACP methyl ester carboxylesterase
MWTPDSIGGHMKKTIVRILVGFSAALMALHAQAPPSVRHISGDVYEYVYILATGPGPYDRIGVHRVVRTLEGRPVAVGDAVFLLHGDAGSFDDEFLGGDFSPRSPSVYLALQGVDVWGIDLAWALVPSTVIDFTFMKDWGMQRQIDDVEKALEFARDIRSNAGLGKGRLPLLGFSSGGLVGYALLNQESQRTCARRQVKAFIPMEIYFKTNDPLVRSNLCDAEAFDNSLLASGQYADNFGQLGAFLGNSAITDPNSAAPPGVLSFFGISFPITNLQALLIASAQSYQVGINSESPFFHFTAGTFGSSGAQGIPTGLRYTRIRALEDIGAAAPPFEPVKLEADAAAVICGGVPTRFDNHLRDIEVPVLYVGAAGGFGSMGSYTLTLLGSKDVQQHIVSFFPPSQKALDYGHSDLLIADNAETVVWSRIVEWLRAHAGDQSCY